MPRCRLVIDEPTTNLWSGSARRAMLSLSSSLSDLSWSYRTAEGGAWDGKASFKLTPGTRAYERLVDRGESGLAWVYWDRDEDAADGLDEETDLLWFGVAEDVEADRAGGLVSVKLRGAGSFLGEAEYSGTHEGDSIYTVVTAIFQSMIDAGDNPVTAQSVTNEGAMKRKVTVEFKNTKVSKALKELAKLAGGTARCCWGIRPRSSSDNFGEAYFALWAGHLWEKYTTTDRNAFSIDRAQLLTYTLAAKNSDVYNSITVVGGEIEGDPNDTARTFYTATVESDDSITRYGRRARVERDGGLKTDGQCAVAAAGICKAESTRAISVNLEYLDSLSNGVTFGGKNRGLVHDLRDGGKLLLVRDQFRQVENWGDSLAAYHAERDTGTARYSYIDLSSQPTGDDEVLIDPHSLTSGEKRLYEFTLSFTGTSYSTSGLYLMELQDRLGLFYLPSGGNWKLAVAYKTTGGTWTALGTSAATRTSAQISAEHTIALEVRYQTAAVADVNAYWSDGTTTTLLVNTSITLANLNSTGTPARITVNGLNAGSGAPVPAGDCGSADYSQVVVWRDWDESGSNTTTTFLDAHANETPPYKHWADLVLMTNAGLTDSNGYGYVRYALGNTSRPSGYDWIPGNAGSASQFEASAEFYRRNHTWLCGDQAAPVEWGSHLEVLPLKVKVEYAGDASPLNVSIDGDGATRPATEVFGKLAEKIAAAEENQRKGEK
jgi:hypothetical protein